MSKWHVEEKSIYDDNGNHIIEAAEWYMREDLKKICDEHNRHNTTPRFHELECPPEYFQDIYLGIKTFEIRKNDRDYRVGDRLSLYEYDPKTENYTGRHVNVEVTYIFDKMPFVPYGYVCMAIRIIT